MNELEKFADLQISKEESLEINGGAIRRRPFPSSNRVPFGITKRPCGQRKQAYQRAIKDLKKRFRGRSINYRAVQRDYNVNTRSCPL